MKICTTTHTVASFGTIPAGSLWADDSPYVTDLSLFADVDAPVGEKPKPVKKAAARKFGEKPKPATEEVTE